MKKQPKYMDSKLFSRLGKRRFRTRRPMEGRLTGIHRSPHRGASIEFAEHKEYSPGDEIRHIDWKAVAKSDKYYVKQFEKESNLKVYLVLDGSASMDYKSGKLTKFEYACSLSAAISYVFLQQADSVGLVMHNQDSKTYIPPRAASSHIYPLCNAMETARPRGSVGVAQGLKVLSEVAGRRAMGFVMSDLFDTSDEMFTLLRQLRGRKMTLTLFHILDPFELEFPFENLTLFQAMESDQRIMAEPRLIRDTYLEEMGRYRQNVKRQCLENDIDYVLVNTAVPVEDVITQFLIKG